MKPNEQSYSKSRQIRNQIKEVVTNPYNVIVVIAIVLLTYLIVFPLIDMLSTTFHLSQRDLRSVPAAWRGNSPSTTGSAFWPVICP